MLKEKLYSEYQKRYKEYKEKHKKNEALQVDAENIQAEGQRKKSDIEVQKRSELEMLSDKKKELERQLASVKKDGINSSVFKDYSESKLRDIEKTESGLRSLEQEKKITQQQYIYQNTGYFNDSRMDKKFKGIMITIGSIEVGILLIMLLSGNLFRHWIIALIILFFIIGAFGSTHEVQLYG